MVYPDHPVRPELQDQQETRANQDHRDRLVLGVNQDQTAMQGVPGRQVSQGDPDLRVLRDQPVVQAFKDQPETMELQELRDSPGHPGRQELTEGRDQQVQPDSPELRDLTVEWALRVLQVFRVLRATQDPGVTTDRPVSLEPQVTPETPDSRGCRDPRVL